MFDNQHAPLRIRRFYFDSVQTFVFIKSGVCERKQILCCVDRNTFVHMHNTRDLFSAFFGFFVVSLPVKHRAAYVVLAVSELRRVLNTELSKHCSVRSVQLFSSRDELN